MTVSLPMCAIDFTNDAMGPEEAAIADRIAEIEVILGNISNAPVYAQLTPIKVLQPIGGEA